MIRKIISFGIKLIFTCIVFTLIFVAILIALNLVENDKEEDIITEFKTVFSINSNIEKTQNIIEEESNALTSIVNQTGQYENLEIQDNLYNQLNKYSKKIYETLELNRDEMKNGTLEIRINSNFDDILSKENGMEELGKYYQSAVEAYIYDKPEIFYLDLNKMYLNVETTTVGNEKSYKVYISPEKGKTYLDDDFENREEVLEAEEELEIIKNQILENAVGTDFDKVKYVHDYIISNLSYDQSLSKENIYDIYGAMYNNVAVCEGYAKMFKYLMDELQIPCIMVIGTATNSKNETENHAWNYVSLNDKWYGVDTTWDDPISSTGYVSEESKYKYFLKGSIDFSKDHIPNGQFTKGGKIFTYQDLEEQNYN